MHYQKKMCQINGIKISLNILRVDWVFNFSPYHKFGYGYKFIHVVKDGYTNIRSKIKINGSYLALSPLRDEFARGAYSLCCCILLRLKYLSVSLMPIKGLKEYR